MRRLFLAPKKLKDSFQYYESSTVYHCIITRKKKSVQELADLSVKKKKNQYISIHRQTRERERIPLQ